MKQRNSYRRWRRNLDSWKASGKPSERVSVKVPLAQDKIQESMHESGIPFDFGSIDAQNMQEIMEALELMSQLYRCFADNKREIGCLSLGTQPSIHQDFLS
ncbi:hypothetical protein DYP60_12420 [Sphaerochaeta halotolerans]|uniref:Uncharacterized protein n=1 Tax=Sphaerochaeta halotolerans TaxID=2293840 RepID=A0A372MEI4_9SPIR|nr:hypothetical protein [Sphaerochaeta halotolerans]RFU93863.1 hypothetical protein DYP60_12420 [Sphaerochaeta halotolerans]